MRLLSVAILFVSWDVQTGMEHAFYPVLFLVLMAASLGVPIPEDVPLIAAGVILSHHAGTPTWTGTLSTALFGIMCGDVVLYTLGSRWGPEACQHRWVSWLITPVRLEKMRAKFNRYGMWMCFFGRFFMGARAAMCITAGVTRFPLWRFVLADLAGAVISIPLLVWLGYWFANVVPTLEAYVHLVLWGMLALAVVILAGFVAYRRFKPRSPDGQAAEPPSQQLDTRQSSPAAKGVPAEPGGRPLERTGAKTYP
jgi:membrane protein DedA with SNARE-associated domain